MTTSLLPPDLEADRTWSGATRARCLACGEHFSTVSNFDKHRPAPRRADGSPSCGRPAEMTRKRSDGSIEPVFTLSAREDGPIWIGYSKDPRYAEAAA